MKIGRTANKTTGLHLAHIFVPEVSQPPQNEPSCYNYTFFGPRLTLQPKFSPTSPLESARPVMKYSFSKR